MRSKSLALAGNRALCSSRNLSIARSSRASLRLTFIPFMMAVVATLESLPEEEDDLPVAFDSYADAGRDRCADALLGGALSFCSAAGTEWWLTPSSPAACKIGAASESIAVFGGETSFISASRTSKPVDALDRMDRDRDRLPASTLILGTSGKLSRDCCFTGAGTPPTAKSCGTSFSSSCVLYVRTDGAGGAGAGAAGGSGAAPAGNE